MGARCDDERYFGEVQRHGLGVAEGQDETSTLALFRADRAKDVCRFGPLVFGCWGPCPALCPAPRDLVFLADAGLVLKPDLYGRALREGSPDFCQLGSEAPFLKASMA